MTTPQPFFLDNLFDDLFHGCAFAAYIEEMVATREHPCPTATKYRAYRYYEEALAEKNASRAGNA